MRPVCFTAVAEAALKHENLKPPVRMKLDRGARGPLLEANVLTGIFEERHQPHAIAFLDLDQRRLVGIDPDMPAVGEVELPELHEHRAAALRAGRVTGLRRVADIGPCRKIAMLVLKHALEHKKFLTAIMHMR